MIRRFGPPPEPGRRYIRRPGAYALLPLGGRLLLTHQAEPEPEVQLPGGGIDPGESPLRALHREVAEETGWHIAGAQRIGAFRRFVFMPEYDLWAEKICIVFLARPVLRIGTPSEPGHRAVLLPAAEAALMLGNPGDRFFAARFAKRFMRR